MTHGIGLYIHTYVMPDTMAQYVHSRHIYHIRQVTIDGCGFACDRERERERERERLAVGI